MGPTISSILFQVSSVPCRLAVFLGHILEKALAPSSLRNAERLVIPWLLLPCRLLRRTYFPSDVPKGKGNMVLLKRFADTLRGLFRSNAQLTNNGTAEVAARLERNVLRLVGNMPTLPDVATRAMTLANNPNTTAVDFARLIEGDTAIATELLRIANSVIYSGGSPAVKLPQAVVRLGMFRCKNLIASISMKSLIWNMIGDERLWCEALWHHGQVTAYLCSQLNRSYRLMFAGEEFAAGLLHDIGRILILLADPECFTRIDAMDFCEEEGILDRERADIGIDHCALGGWFGEQSQLPDILVQTMKHHHEPHLSENARRFVTLVAAADHMANHLQRLGEAESYRPDENAALASLWKQWPQARKERLLGELPSLMEQALQAAAAK
jgi:HD-like signal output (HDOD) protein